MDLLIGSSNQRKIEELAALLLDQGILALGLEDLPQRPAEPEESGSTFEQNARLKALAYARATGLWTLADDSGLEVSALGNRPGVRSARYAGEGATDSENNALLRQELKHVPCGQRQARYVAVVALASPQEILLETRGECAGIILEEERGQGGFGYDPLFLVPELGRTFAELDSCEKSAISHRGKALHALASGLRQLLDRS